MAEELWIDGFNLFHQWKATRALMRRPADMGASLHTALHRLAGRLRKRKSRTRVFLDGGIEAGWEQVAGLRVHYAGPGNKADDAMAAILKREGGGRRIVAVTSDRILGERLKALGARVESTETFLDQHPAPPAKQSGSRGVEAYKERDLTSAEVDAWLAIFDDDEGDDTDS